jgi:hypothetical protein
MRKLRRKKGEERTFFSESFFQENIIQKKYRNLFALLPLLFSFSSCKECKIIIIIIIIIIIKFYIRTSKNNMQEPRRQSKRIAESGTGGVLETVKALLPKTRRAPAAAKKPAPPVEPEQPQLAREPAAPQTPLEKELHRLYYDYKFYVGRDKLYCIG